MSEDTDIFGWTFSKEAKLGNGDDRTIVIGETLTVNPPIVPCEHGLHLSIRAIDALQYAPGNLCWRVRGSGIIFGHGNPIDKYACSERTAIAGFDAAETLRAFARWCALSVIGNWNAPRVVREYLTTGDESLRAATLSAAAAAAAWSAATATLSAAAATATLSAAAAAAWSAATARSSDAWAATKDAQNTRLESMLLEGCGGRYE